MPAPRSRASEGDHRGGRRRRASAGRHRGIDPAAGARVPIHSQSLGGLDSLLSMVQMPAGIPGRDLCDRRAGAVNAALYAAAILALADPAIAAALDNWRRAQSEAVPERPDSR